MNPAPLPTLAALTLLSLAACATRPAPESATAVAAVDWPQGAGPHGDWSSEGPEPPLHFSVRRDEHVLWRTPLPETGQGGVTVAGGRAFVASMAPWDPATPLPPDEAARFKHATEGRAVVGAHIDAHCLDASTGELLWTRRILGSVPAIYTYPFSDATAASPVACAGGVIFTNAAGRVVCFDLEGQVRWERAYTPAFDGPFNKQFEPVLVKDGDRQVFVHMEPFAPDRGSAQGGGGASSGGAGSGGDSKKAATTAAGHDGDLHGRWHYLIGLDAGTGAELWRSQDALTQYNAPTLVGGAAPRMLHARGGPHAVPERPVGVSLTDVSGDGAGARSWRFEDPRGNHEASLQTMAHDERYAYWILKEPRNELVVLDLTSGEEVRALSLVRGVTRRHFDEDRADWVTETGVDLAKGVFPARYSMIAAGGAVYFQCYATAWGKPSIGPAYSFARVDPTAGTVEYLEVPTDVLPAADGEGETFLWRTPRVARPLNSRGEEVTGDDRSRWDGWDWVFNGSPTRVNDRLYFTLASGVVYVLDAAARPFDGAALLAVNDLGPAGEVWTANSVSYAAGRLYHRTGAEVLCFGR